MFSSKGKDRCLYSNVLMDRTRIANNWWRCPRYKVCSRQGLFCSGDMQETREETISLIEWSLWQALLKNLFMSKYKVMVYVVNPISKANKLKISKSMPKSHGHYLIITQKSSVTHEIVVLDILNHSVRTFLKSALVVFLWNRNYHSYTLYKKRKISEKYC